MPRYRIILFFFLLSCSTFGQTRVEQFSFDEFDRATSLQIDPTSLSDLPVETTILIDDPQKVAFAIQFVQQRPDNWLRPFGVEPPAFAFLITFYEDDQELGSYGVGPTDRASHDNYLTYGTFTRGISSKDRVLLIETLGLSTE